MRVQHYHFVSVAKEADLLVRHLHCTVVHSRHVLDGLVELFGTKLNLGVTHLNGNQAVGLLV
jgi:CO dehydrogenase/acetyl-CoA synthase alpha subunit